MASLVQELEQEAYDSKASLSNMLRKAKAVAVKLQLEQPIAWVEAELNGYGAGEVPDYRNQSAQSNTCFPQRRSLWFLSRERVPNVCPD